MEWRTAFIGREREIAEVRSLLQGTRLLTLTGPGGIGKTRLATVAIGPGSSPGHRPVVVELAGVREADQLLPAIGAAVGIRESSAIDAVSVVSERLGRRPSLLLLDNFEQIAGAAPTVGTLLDVTPSLRVVVTSRIPLHLSGEQEYQVPPLATPGAGAGTSVDAVREIESVRLFVERAHAVQPDFTLTDDNAEAVAQICRELDGLPLALELAASRLKVLSPHAIRKRLGQRLALLTGGAADAPARQRTLRATIEWSYELLPPVEREVLIRCSVFNGFGLEGAAAVLDLAADGLLEAIGRLVDHNLLTSSAGSDDEPRFRMLETIREFGITKLSSVGATAVRDRHADFYIDLAETAAARLQGREHAKWLARLNEEVDNIRGAHAWLSERDDPERLSRLAAAMSTYFRYYGSINEGRAWLAEALERGADATPSARAYVVMKAGWLEAIGGDLSHGRGLLEQALLLNEAIGDPRRIAETLYHLGATLVDLALPDQARAFLGRGLEVARREDYADLEGRLLNVLSMVVGEFAPAIVDERRRLVLEGIEASTRAGDLQRVALALIHLGWTDWDAGDRLLALERWTEATRLTRSWGERAFLGSVLVTRSIGESDAGLLEASRSSLLEGLELIREAGAIPDIIGSLASVASWLIDAGHAGAARAIWNDAEHLLRREEIEVHVTEPLGWVRTQMGGPSWSPDQLAGDSGVTAEQALDAAELAVRSVEVRQAAGSAGYTSPFDLTPREREVLALVVAGRSNAEIGEALFISRKTASVHVANIKDKLAADSRIGIVTIALERGLVSSQTAEPGG